MTGAAFPYAFASDNTAGICPEALAALGAANAGHEPSYGEDRYTAEARAHFSRVFETDCEVHLVFNGTAANSLALAALCQRHHAIVCHEQAHVQTDECGAPEFFTGGGKLLPVAGAQAKVRPEAVAEVCRRRSDVHFSKVRALSLTQSTEFGTVYQPDEVRALSAVAREHSLLVHLDGARFANAAATLAERGHSPADLTWRAGVDVVSLGGTKNGLLTTEAVVFFNRALAEDFDRRVKQSGQLASKARFAGAQWSAVLRDGTWLRHAAHANRQARALADGLMALGFALLMPVEANGVFVEFPPVVAAGLEARGWHFYRFVGEHGYRLMCSWATVPAEIAALLADVRALGRK